MNSVVMELTGREKEILDEAAAKVEEEMACLSALSREQRLARFRERQYPHPISFEREIGGTSTPSTPISAIRPPKPQKEK